MLRETTSGWQNIIAGGKFQRRGKVLIEGSGGVKKKKKIWWEWKRRYVGGIGEALLREWEMTREGWEGRRGETLAKRLGEGELMEEGVGEWQETLLEGEKEGIGKDMITGETMEESENRKRNEGKGDEERL